MSNYINGTSIELTRGDSLSLKVNITKDGEEYIPEEGDSVRFALKKLITDDECLILKDIPTDTMVLHLTPEDTKDLAYGSYIYDMQITFANGDVDTFITKSKFKITEEVY